MSFSSEVKEELAKQYSKSRHCQLAELAGMLEMEGSYDKASGQLRMDTDNVLLKEKYKSPVKEGIKNIIENK